VNTFLTARLAAVPLALKSNQCEVANAGFSTLTDEALLTRLGAGELEALGCLFQRYSQVVRRISARILRNAAETDDFVQDLFLFLQRKCDVFDSSRSSARSWIVQMAYQRAIERRRHLTSRQFYSREEIGIDANQVVGIATAENDYSAEAVFGRNGLEQVLKALSEDQRETLRLHFFEGYTLAEISEKLGQPLGSIRHHYYRGLDKLRKRMFGNTVPVEKHREK
jgi:RNA polymerase sigma-70 factor, ECF subfamily